MKKELKSADRVMICILGLLSLLLIGRGAVAVVSGVFEATARYSGPYELHDAAARFMGGGYIGLGLIVLCGIGFQLELGRRPMLMAAAASAAFSLGCFVLRFIYG